MKLSIEAQKFEQRKQLLNLLIANWYCSFIAKDFDTKINFIWSMPE